MFTLTQSVENATGAEVRLQPYGIIARHGKPSDLKNFYILHEGVIRMADGELQETEVQGDRRPAGRPGRGRRARRDRRGGGERLDRLHRPLLDDDAGAAARARPSPR